MITLTSVDRFNYFFLWSQVSTENFTYEPSSLASGLYTDYGKPYGIFSIIFLNLLINLATNMATLRWQIRESELVADRQSLVSCFKDTRVGEMQEDGWWCHYDRKGLKSSLRGGPEDLLVAPLINLQRWSFYVTVDYLFCSIKISSKSFSIFFWLPSFCK